MQEGVSEPVHILLLQPPVDQSRKSLSVKPITKLVHDIDLRQVSHKSKGASQIQLEIIYEELEKWLADSNNDKITAVLAKRLLDEEIAVLEGETALKNSEIVEMESNMIGIAELINSLRQQTSDACIEVRHIKDDIKAKIQDEKNALLMGKNRVERVRGALLDLYSEQLVLKACFVAYATSLKGVSQKARITREINEQTHHVILDIPVLKCQIQELRERLTAFKVQTAETSVKLHDKIDAERQELLTTAKEQKYLVQLYEEEARVLDRLGAELKLQLDSALQVAAKLGTEIHEHQTYFVLLQQRLTAAFHHEQRFSMPRLSHLCPHKGHPSKQQGPALGAPSALKKTRFCPSCGFCGRWCPSCKLKCLSGATMQEITIDCENKRSAMRAQIKFIEQKIHQLEIEVYISKMNVEIQMLQTSIRIETWKKTGTVPVQVQLSGIYGGTVRRSTAVQAVPAASGSSFNPGLMTSSFNPALLSGGAAGFVPTRTGGSRATAAGIPLSFGAVANGALTTAKKPTRVTMQTA